MTTDFTVTDEGTIVLLVAETDAAKAWGAENLPASTERMRWGNAAVIEHRYAQDIIEGIQNDGLTVEVA